MAVVDVMRIADAVAARRRKRHGPHAREKRPCEEHARAYLAGKLWGKARGAKPRGVDGCGSCCDVARYLGSEALCAFEHVLHVLDAGNVLKRHRTISEHCRRNHRQRRVLVSRNAVHSAYWMPTIYK